MVSPVAIYAAYSAAVSQFPLGEFTLRGVFSFILLCAALYIILSKRYSVSVVRWAYGIITLLVGYWLRS